MKRSLKILVGMVLCMIMFGVEVKALSCPDMAVDEFLAVEGISPTSVSCLADPAPGGLFGQMSGEAIQNLSIRKPNLVTLELLYNKNLVGSIPTEIGLLTNLEFLSLIDNSLTGSIPASMFLTPLETLQLVGNKLNGTLATEIGNLPLTFLSLTNNRLSGKLPSELFFLPNLFLIQLGLNRFSGPLSVKVAETELQKLDIEHNSFTGTLPVELFSLTNLEILNIGHNSFTGTLPVELFSLTNLENLQISDNQFEGTFPSEIALLTQLTGLFIKPNNFSGTMPFFDVNAVSSDTFPGEVFSHTGDDSDDKLAIILGSSLGGVALVALGVFVVVTTIYKKK